MYVFLSRSSCARTRTLECIRNDIPKTREKLDELLAITDTEATTTPNKTQSLQQQLESVRSQALKLQQQLKDAVPKVPLQER